MYSYKVMGVSGSGMSPVTNFKFLGKVLVWLSLISAPIYAPFRISSPQVVMPLYHSLLARGDGMGGYFSDSLFLFPISSTDSFSISDLRVISFRVMRPSSYSSGLSIVILFTPAPLDIGFKFLSLLGMSPLFFIVISVWSLDYYLESIMDAIYMNLSSK